jgi:hypothetical protein
MSEERIKLTVEVDVPKELYRDFLQHLRDFDTAHDPNHIGRIHFEMMADCRTMTTEECRAVFASLDPPFEYETVIPKEKIGEA